MTSSGAARRSSDAQMRAMAAGWPDFNGRKLPDGTLMWLGPLMPKARVYWLSVFWHPGVMSLPYVVVNEPALEPRPGGGFAGIPHLIFHAERPEQSGLCLFDPAAKEWSPADLIAATTVKWASEWLVYYELWHLTGEWLAPGVGYESVARMHQAEAAAVKSILADVH